MAEKRFLLWPLQPSKAMGLGILPCMILYFVTGGSVRAGVAAAMVDTGKSDCPWRDRCDSCGFRPVADKV